MKSIKEFNVTICDCDDMASVTAFQAKYIKQIKKLAEAHPDEVKIIADGKENGGVLVAHLPKKYCKISFGESRKYEMTEEQKAAAAERLRSLRKKANEEDKFTEEGWL